jgi:hypothetical protein
MKSLDRCLYCSSLANSLEHVLPAAFGEFTGASNLENCVCGECNNKRLGVLDEQLARCGPEGFFRKWYGIEGRDHHDKVNPFYRGSAGGRRLEFSTFDPVLGVEVNLEIENGQARQMRELIFVESSGKTHHLPIREDTTAERLLQEFKKLGVVKPFEVRLSIAPEERGWVEPLLKQAWPESGFGEATLGSKDLKGLVGKVQMNARYFRAFAKVGFHYFLTQFRNYTGHEELFSRLRQFISEDVEGPITRANEFIGLRQCPLLGEMLDPNIRPDGWRAHVLCAEVTPGGCFAHVQMFLTADWSAPIYTIRLAVDPTVVDARAAGHVYRYYPDGARGRFLGEAECLQITQTNLPTPPLAPVVASAGE